MNIAGDNSKQDGLSADVDAQTAENKVDAKVVDSEPKTEELAENLKDLSTEDGEEPEKDSKANDAVSDEQVKSGSEKSVTNQDGDVVEHLKAAEGEKKCDNSSVDSVENEEAAPTEFFVEEDGAIEIKADSQEVEKS